MSLDSESAGPSLSGDSYSPVESSGTEDTAVCSIFEPCMDEPLARAVQPDLGHDDMKKTHTTMLTKMVDGCNVRGKVFEGQSCGLLVYLYQMQRQLFGWFAGISLLQGGC